MKNKVVAGVLALTFGGIGVHQFYLKNTAKGIFYAVFFWTFIPTILSIIDAIVILSMDDRKFDERYNWKYLDDNYQELDSDYERRRYEQNRRRQDYRHDHSMPQTSYNATQAQSVEDWRRERAMQKQQLHQRKPVVRANPYRESGVRKFKAFDFEGAIVDFEKALDVEPKDIASHFNLACAYSIMEEKEEAFFHLDRAIKHGFKDVQRIQSHDSLAFLRMQEEFFEFQQNGYQLAVPKEDSEKKLNENGNLLDQLQKLAELREKGLLTDEEFSIQKRRLLD